MDQNDRALACVVTGATSGIGRALMDPLAARGLSLIGVGRSVERNRSAEASLRNAHPAARIVYLRTDLALQSQVRELAELIEGVLDDWGIGGLDGLVNNAAAVPFRRRITPEGFEKQWAVNHLAPFLLTNLLLPRLERAPGARVVTVSSSSHRGARMHWNDLQQLSGFYNGMRAYGQSKLANILFTLELNRRLGEGSSVQAFAADPGLVNTGLGAKETPFFVSWIWNIYRQGGISPEEAAEGLVKLLLDPVVEAGEAIYWRRGRAVEPDPRALDPESARRLWEISAGMCGLEDVSRP